jgi:hypothetical protein
MRRLCGVVSLELRDGLIGRDGTYADELVTGAREHLVAAASATLR